MIALLIITLTWSFNQALDLSVCTTVISLLLHQHAFHRKVLGALAGWFFLLSHPYLLDGGTLSLSQYRVCSCWAPAGLPEAGMHPAHTLQCSPSETCHQSRALEILVCQSIHAALITEQVIWFAWSSSLAQLKY